MIFGEEIFHLWAGIDMSIHYNEVDYPVWTLIGLVQVALYGLMIYRIHKRKRHLIQAPIFRIFYLFLFVLTLGLINSIVMTEYSRREHQEYKNSFLIQKDDFYIYCMLNEPYLVQIISLQAFNLLMYKVLFMFKRVEI